MLFILSFCMGVLTDLGVILLSSIIIYLSGKRFAESSSKIGDFLNLPRDVKGATFDAISSSLPELLVALYSVIFFKQFEVGIGTIAGSAFRSQELTSEEEQALAEYLSFIRFKKNKTANG